VSRTRNAQEFLQKYHQIRYRYDELHRQRVEAFRTSYARNTNDITDLDDALEAHVREYYVDALLMALNWCMDVTIEDGLPNLLPEAPVRSLLTGRTRFLDYLGAENDGSVPLLIVETKRPNSPLPQRTTSSGQANLHALAQEPWPSVICAGLQGVSLSGEWNEWLDTLKDYVRSVHRRLGHAPRRVVLTSGRWIIIFTDPIDSFLGSGAPDTNRILVFTVEECRDLIAEHYGQIYYLLEHQHVLDEVPPLRVGEVAFHMTSNDIDCAMHGLRLLYIEEPGFLSASPVIKVMPIVFLRSRYGSWFCIESGREVAIPHAPDQLSNHLSTVKNIADGLLSEIGSRLGTILTLTTLESHYASAGDFEILPAVKGKPKQSRHYDEYIIIMGHNTHYLRLEPTVNGCIHHSWGNSNREGSAAPISIQRRSTDPRSFFFSDENHHCAHRDVAVAKSSEITRENRQRCGARSGKDYDPFCEIWRFETQLCCRTCVFEGICTSAPVFRLPCYRGGHVSDGLTHR
jgi:hypothetical protein